MAKPPSRPPPPRKRAPAPPPSPAPSEEDDIPDVGDRPTIPVAINPEESTLDWERPKEWEKAAAVQKEAPPTRRVAAVTEPAVPKRAARGKNPDAPPPTTRRSGDAMAALNRRPTPRLNEVPTKPPPEASNQKTQRMGALHANATSAGLGTPGVSFGGDTDLDALGEPSPVQEPPTTRPTNEPPADSLDLGLAVDDTGNDALDLVGRDAPPPSVEPMEPSVRADPLAELRERYALGDFSGALVIAEGVLSSEPDNADAQRYAESCRDVLKQMYAARLGPLSQVPTVGVPLEQLRWLTLDHRAGFLLSHVDGVSTLEEILDVSGMPHLEAMRIIFDLVQQRVIVLQ